MLNFLVGHRGSGKTSLLGRIQKYRPQSRCLDLDAEIETRTGTSVSEIFRNQGEAAFRQIEKKVLDTILTENSTVETYLALGAGFAGALPKGSRVLWIRRKTDSLGRIFFDRPRLDLHMSALAEFQARFQNREDHYRLIGTDVLEIREGIFDWDLEENKYFNDSFQDLGGALTLQKKDFAGDFSTWIQRRLKWGIGVFELRNDLLDEGEIKEALKFIPPEHVLFSYRKNSSDYNLNMAVLRWDWDISLGTPPDSKNGIISLHEALNLSKMIEQIQSHRGYFYKISPQIESFDDLNLGHSWMMENSSRRAFLPRSKQIGRWSWYRQLTARVGFLNFFREGDGSSTEQPTLLDFAATKLLNKNNSKFFAAVLGSPVAHSYTPVEHREFFGSSQVLAIDMKLEDWTEDNFDILKSLGLRFAAVTSPLKQKAFEFSQYKSPQAQSVESANTLAYDEAIQDWRIHNTDLMGLERLCEGIDSREPIAVWGGGGVLNVIKKVFPRAVFYSASKQSPRTERGATDPKVLIWAAAPDAEVPKFNWNPHTIIDLNYREDSRAREYAQEIGAQYHSGLKMFYGQAIGQREFWSEYVGQ